MSKCYGRNNDPFEMVSKFNSTCKKCGKEIKKGEKIVYFPLTKSAYHAECGAQSLAESRSAIMDEEVLNCCM